MVCTRYAAQHYFRSWKLSPYLLMESAASNFLDVLTCREEWTEEALGSSGVSGKSAVFSSGLAEADKRVGRFSICSPDPEFAFLPSSAS